MVDQYKRLQRSLRGDFVNFEIPKINFSQAEPVCFKDSKNIMYEILKKWGIELSSKAAKHVSLNLENFTDLVLDLSRDFLTILPEPTNILC